MRNALRTRRSTAPISRPSQRIPSEKPPVLAETVQAHPGQQPGFRSSRGCRAWVEIKARFLLPQPHIHPEAQGAVLDDIQRLSGKKPGARPFAWFQPLPRSRAVGIGALVNARGIAQFCRMSARCPRQCSAPALPICITSTSPVSIRRTSPAGRRLGVDQAHSAAFITPAQVHAGAASALPMRLRKNAASMQSLSCHDHTRAVICEARCMPPMREKLPAASRTGSVSPAEKARHPRARPRRKTPTDGGAAELFRVGLEG